MQEIAFEIDAQRVGRASGYLGGLTIERYTFTGATIPAGTRLAILTRAGVTIAAAEIAEGNTATVDTNTQEVADLLRYQPLGACESVYIAIGDADNILALIPAVMRKNWLDDEATHPPVPANRYPTKIELDEWLARFDERAAAAEAAKADAQEAAAQAAQRAEFALAAKTAAESAATASQTAQGKAESAQAAAETAQKGAEAAKNAAAQSATAAETAKADAQSAAAQAASRAEFALAAKTEAQSAATAAQTAQGKAEAAQAAAETAKADAEAAQEAAASSATAAANSVQAAKASETAAAESASAAKASETAAANSATAAASSATASEAAKSGAEAAKTAAEASATRAEIALNNGCVYDVRDVADATIGLDKTLTAYKHAPTGETSYTFNAPQGAEGKIIVFWLWLVIGEPAPQVTFPSSVTWLYEPSLAPNTQALLAFMSVNGGASYVANVQWEKPL